MMYIANHEPAAFSIEPSRAGPKKCPLLGYEGCILDFAWFDPLTRQIHIEEEHSAFVNPNHVQTTLGVRGRAVDKGFVNIPKCLTCSCELTPEVATRRVSYPTATGFISPWQEYVIRCHPEYMFTCPVESESNCRRLFFSEEAS